MHHPTAVIESGARLGADVEVGPFAYIAAGAEIADGCRIGPHAVVWGSVRMGARCRVHAGAVLGDWPQDVGFDGAPSEVHIGTECWIREGVTIHRSTVAGGATVVGDHCLLMSNSHVAHDVCVGARVMACSGALLGGHAVVGDRAFLSGHAAVHQFVHIGRLAMLGAACFVSKDVPPYFTMRGAAMNRPAGVNVVGMRRAGLDSAGRRQATEAFRLLCRSGMNTSQAIEQLRVTYPEGPAADIVAFAAESTRGLCVAMTPTA